MNPASYKEAQALFAATKKSIDKTGGIPIVVAPPSLYLRDLAHAYRGKKIAFAVQSARAEDGGAHTGDISLAQARESGARYAIIGHAERRALGERNEDANAQVLTALRLDMVPILCIGESSRGDHGEHFAFIKEQLTTGLGDVAVAKLGKILIAYEPVWAIGASAAMKPHDMHEMAIFIRKTLLEVFGDRALSTKILYGGSIDATTAPEMMRDGDVAGLLVGRASAEPAALGALVRALIDA